MRAELHAAALFLPVMPLAVVVTADDGRLLYHNGEAEQLVEGLPHGEAFALEQLLLDPLGEALEPVRDADGRWAWGALRSVVGPDGRRCAVLFLAYVEESASR